MHCQAAINRYNKALISGWTPPGALQQQSLHLMFRFCCGGPHDQSAAESWEIEFNKQCCFRWTILSSTHPFHCKLSLSAAACTCSYSVPCSPSNRVCDSPSQWGPVCPIWWALPVHSSVWCMTKTVRAVEGQSERACLSCDKPCAAPPPVYSSTSVIGPSLLPYESIKLIKHLRQLGKVEGSTGDLQRHEANKVGWCLSVQIICCAHGCNIKLPRGLNPNAWFVWRRSNEHQVSQYKEIPWLPVCKQPGLADTYDWFE